MSDQQPQQSRFTPQTANPQSQTTHERLSTTTVGLVALSDFRKRRAEVLEQQEREARETLLSRNASSAVPTPPDRSQTATPNNASDSGEGDKQKRKKKRVKALVSFGGDEEEREEESPVIVKKKKRAEVKDGGDGKEEEGEGTEGDGKGAEVSGGRKITVNSSVGIVPRALTKAALRREAAEREALRKEFLLLQAAVKASEIAIPFVFYDGTNIPGGMVRVKKGDFIWVFLDKSRKVGAELGVGGEKSATARRDWARVGVDDLMLHYEFYFFIMNQTMGPEGKPLFDYSAEAPLKDGASDSAPASVGGVLKGGPDINTLEGASDDPALTKVVDRRWYQRNKHIYPASVWQEFEPEKDYRSEIRRDPGGNAFFFSK
ncbi:XAP5, circadian clock regulator-domain-containing protein [Immersiella caudata]|uniref:XAP5, circadian clock regulator-domain-containing protein n=1 Tax=Immersiella caudata TaxID=314043 RepID=A0AA39WSP7_9PEZI|nr:XAP5, circadian clock regulator-domain-containing protein [Immersiella caudata]